MFLFVSNTISVLRRLWRRWPLWFRPHTQRGMRPRVYGQGKKNELHFSPRVTGVVLSQIEEVKTKDRSNSVSLKENFYSKIYKRWGWPLQMAFSSSAGNPSGPEVLLFCRDLTAMESPLPVNDDILEEGGVEWRWSIRSLRVFREKITDNVIDNYRIPRCWWGEGRQFARNDLVPYSPKSVFSSSPSSRASPLARHYRSFEGFLGLTVFCGQGATFKSRLLTLCVLRRNCRLD